VSPSSRTPLYPLFLKVAGRRVLVVGGGTVAERKVRELLCSSAAVTVVAPQVGREIRRLASEGTVAWRARRFRPADVDGAWLVVAATGAAAVQRSVHRAAEERRVFVIAVDDPANGSAQTPAVVVRDPYVLAISSTGEAPALTRLLRELLEQVLPEREWVQAARALRTRWRAAGTPMAARFPELVRLFRRRARKK